MFSKIIYVQYIHIRNCCSTQDHLQNGITPKKVNGKGDRES